LVASVSVCGTLAVTHFPARASSTHTVTGTITGRPPYPGGGEVAPGCAAYIEGAAVTITDGDFRPVAHGHIVGNPGLQGGCLVTFRVTGVPDEESYTVTMNSGLHSDPISHNELKSADWTIPLVYLPGGDEP
jgi:hypothetical protein